MLSVLVWVAVWVLAVLLAGWVLWHRTRRLYRKLRTLGDEVGAATRRLEQASDLGRAVLLPPVEPELAVFADPGQLRSAAESRSRARHRAGQE